MADSLLAAPLRLRANTSLPNRLVKAAMSEVLADRDGAPSEALVRLYRRWGASGAGLLITGHVIVDRGGMGEPGNVVADRVHLDAFRRWAQAGQSGGARMWMQINHAGRQSPRRITRTPVAPSAVAMRRGFGTVFATPRALTEPEILALIDRYAAAALVAKDAGFHGVEIHAAHGYLISQFLSPLVNHRTDGWGGDAERRRRFLLEVVRAVRAAVGPAFPIGVKLNSADFQRGGFTIEESMEVARALDGAGIDVLEISGGSYESPAMAGGRRSTREREAYFLEYAKQIRTVTTLPLLLTGGLRSRAVMEQALASGAIDLIGLARPMTHAPELPRHLLDGTLDRAPEVDIHHDIKLVDDALQAMWFQAQIHELAKGNEPDLGLGRWTALWRGARASFLPSLGGHA